MTRRLKLFFGLLVPLLAVPAIAHADPITAAVVAWTTSIGINAAFATFVVNTVLYSAGAATRDRARPSQDDSK